jgi:hypothetical protein
MLEDLKRDILTRLTAIEGAVKSSGLYRDAVFTDLQVSLSKLTSSLDEIKNKIG